MVSEGESYVRILGFRFKKRAQHDDEYLAECLGIVNSDLGSKVSWILVYYQC